MRKLLAKVLFSAALATTVVACGHTPPTKTFVKVEQVALGKVVVYRNGVAFYERRATVTGGKLTVSVPRDRVDDFLKSLTVVDAKTQRPLPVSFPRQQSESGAFLEMTLDVPMAQNPGETADVLLTYVTEAPVWKPSYRIAVGQHGKVMIEGWAIVDNTSGEDWKDVTVGVGSSSALSFRYDLWSVRTVQRETLEADAQFAVAPPTAVSPYGGSQQGQAPAMVAELGDDEIRRPPGHPENLDETRVPQAAEREASYDSVVALGAVDYEAEPPRSGARGRGAGGGGARATTATRADRSPPRVAKAEPARDPARDHRRARVGDGDRKIAALAPQIVKNKQSVVIEGYADASEPGSEQRALDRANIVRNQLIDAGVPPAQVRVVNRGVVAGQKAGVRMVAEAPPPDDATGRAAGGSKLDPAAPPVGESHFQSTTPMTVARGTSVMVSMVRAETEGEEVYLFDPESDRGNKRFAFNAVRLKNPTEYTLETGPVTVYGKDRYIGEGLTEPIPPSANVVVPYALDRQVVVDRDDTSEHQVSKLVTLQRGVLTAEVQHVRSKKLTFTSRLHKATKVYVRHTPQKGWITLEAPEHYWRIGDAHLYEIELRAGESKTVVFAEATPLTRTLDLGSPTTLEMMKVFVQSPHPSPELKKQLESLLAIHREVVDTADRITSLRERAVEYRQRMDELHEQILSLKKVKSAASLQKNLTDKMKDISNRVQQTTIDIVNAQEKLMLAKVRFQDQLAEMTLPDAAANLAIKP
ncbi:MAG: OmpA family protein [Kofleriaceae bacterium]|nr:OmpA family protein [Kofleriaceae bacterium]MCL4225705.1 OmpA family protein [Myxococcales bacterium]